MKIAVFTDNYLPNTDGVVRSIINSTNLLTLKGHEILIFAPSVKKYKDRIQENVKVFRFKSITFPTYKNYRITFPNVLKILKIIRTEKPDIIHIQNPAIMGTSAILCGRIIGLPVIGTFHTLATEVLTYISIYRLLKIDKLINSFQNKINTKENGFLSKLRQLEKLIIKLKDLENSEKNKNTNVLQKEILWSILIWVYNKCIIVTTPSKTIIKELEGKGLKTRLIFLSNGLDIKKFKPKMEYKENSYKIIHVGRLGYEKNIEVIIKAMPFILKFFPKATLTIVGEGPALESLTIFVKQLNLSDSVIFAGFIPNNELPCILRDHDIFVTASTMETQGLVILESMSCGLPVVGVDKYAIPDLVKNGFNGFIVKPFDYKEIAGYITKIFKDKKLLEEFSENSVMIARRHDIDKVIEELEDIYRLAIDMYEMRKKTIILKKT